jgi:hypothetical protein
MGIYHGITRQYIRSDATSKAQSTGYRPTLSSHSADCNNSYFDVPPH